MPKFKILLSVIILISFFIGTSAFVLKLTGYTLNSDFNLKSSKSTIIQAQSSSLYQDNSSSSSVESTRPLTEYEQYAKELEAIVQQKDPSASLTKMAVDVYNVNIVQANCHSLTHAVGHYALKKYNQDTGKAISYNVDICGGGYVHGIIEEFLHTSSDPKSNIVSLCPGGDGTCLHALGHGAMMINKYVISESVKDCQLLNNSNYELLCAEGLFMENFDSENTDEDEKPDLKPGDPFYPCNEYSLPYIDACFYYSGRYLLKNIKDPFVSLQSCNRAGQYINSCIRGMSAGIVRNDLLHPEKMEAYCSSVPYYLDSCLQGSVNYHVLMFTDSQKTISDMCSKFNNDQISNKCINFANNSPFRK